jgi:elongation factor P
MSSVESKQTFKRDGKFYTVLDLVSHSQGRGGTTLKAKLEDLSTGKVCGCGVGSFMDPTPSNFFGLYFKVLTDVSFRPNESVEIVDPTTRTVTLLYHIRDEVHLIDPESGEEFELPMSQFVGGEEALTFFDETVPLVMVEVDGSVIKAEGPDFVNATVKEIDTTKGSVNAEHRSATRNAITTTGGQVVVPAFIKVGDKIKVDVRQRRFISRV